MSSGEDYQNDLTDIPPDSTFSTLPPPLGHDGTVNELESERYNVKRSGYIWVLSGVAPVPRPRR